LAGAGTEKSQMTGEARLNRILYWDNQSNLLIFSLHIRELLFLGDSPRRTDMAKNRNSHQPDTRRRLSGMVPAGHQSIRPGRKSPVRGCMVIKPWGYALWENIVPAWTRHVQSHRR
jgi:hypothetical protein